MLSLVIVIHYVSFQLDHLGGKAFAHGRSWAGAYNAGSHNIVWSPTVDFRNIESILFNIKNSKFKVFIY